MKIRDLGINDLMTRASHEFVDRGETECEPGTTCFVIGMTNAVFSDENIADLRNQLEYQIIL